MKITPADAQPGDVVIDSTGWVSQYLAAGSNFVPTAGFYCPGANAPIQIQDVEVTLAVRGGQVITT